MSQISGFQDGLPPGTGAPGRPLNTVKDALACLQAFAAEGNWSVRTDSGKWFLYTGDQWVGCSEDRSEFNAFAIGTAVAVALLRGPNSRAN